MTKDGLSRRNGIVNADTKDRSGAEEVCGVEANERRTDRLGDPLIGRAADSNV